ncbi:Serine/threonine-protein phosphatase 2A regulatory subunit B'' subunit gamma [Clydaea vesicula]|uniref:Serine/threonine-protein phosphatase 2A regulatory subunit B'' subunit gamma n=1 Tax=Clydaea vesicula TaxID=447962 RepID=A0AAD5XXN5_9FUNG|nr:Serine/threonine-protein phosphatase 2A regulatory subunit B'' subunit gamma [Clydaea vesicula]
MEIKKLISLKSKNIFQQTLHRAAYKLKLDKQEGKLITNDELDTLWDLLNETAGFTYKSDQENVADDKLINFKEFELVKERLNNPKKFNSYFKPSIFVRFPGDESCRISILQFYNYVLRKVSLDQAWVDLAKYDLDCDGCLNEDDLNKYIGDLMAFMNLPNITISFKKFYQCTAVRKFMFFLDSMKLGKIPIINIILSPILTELFELRESEPLEGFEKRNWFSAYSSQRVYGQFLNLDTDQNGMLSREEIAEYNNGTITGIFFDRLFEECQTYKNEITSILEMAVIKKMVTMGYEEMNADDITV